jgi:phage baseplate assembly protein W
MAIKISNLQQLSDEYEIKKFVFSDLHLDLKKNGYYSEAIQQKNEGNDLAVDYDESAIRNSLKNLFNTRPGQRFLFPKYGLDLYQYLFEPISENIGRSIGDRIVRAVELYEPRVKVKNCYVKCLMDDNQYDITLIVEFPVFHTVASINTTLDIQTQSFIFIETSRNK